jgi:hypothetical protein
MKTKLRQSKDNLYCVVINNSKKEFFNFMIKTDTRRQALNIARNRFGALSDYRAVNVCCRAVDIH